jgi:predicted RNA-binding Zn ribbon-like protein
MMVRMSTASKSAGAPDADQFRLDNPDLCFRFTATLSDRHGRTHDRLTTPTALASWLAANTILFTGAEPTLEHLEAALGLREAIHRAGVAIATGGRAKRADVEIVNAAAIRGRYVQQLNSRGVAEFQAEGADPVDDALSLIATDAITILGGDRGQLVKSCEWPQCRGLFVDTSRGCNRRWCSMNYCGNRAKKSALRQRAAQ